LFKIVNGPRVDMMHDVKFWKFVNASKKIFLVCGVIPLHERGLPFRLAPVFTDACQIRLTCLTVCNDFGVQFCHFCEIVLGEYLLHIFLGLSVGPVRYLYLWLTYCGEVLQCICNNINAKHWVHCAFNMWTYFTFTYMWTYFTFRKIK